MSDLLRTEMWQRLISAASNHVNDPTKATGTALDVAATSWGALSNVGEVAFHRGFKAGVADQKKADPPPKAKQYRDLLREAIGALKDLHHHVMWDPDGELTQEEFDALFNATEQVIAKAERLLR